MSTAVVMGPVALLKWLCLCRTHPTVAATTCITTAATGTTIITNTRTRILRVSTEIYKSQMGGSCSSEVADKPRLNAGLSRTRSSFECDDSLCDVSVELTDQADQHFPITTFIRALPMQDGRVLDRQRISRASWSKHMQACDRLVVEDKQFQAGGYIRSVPRIQDTSNSTIMKR
jgi:hypothetical protein